MDTQKRRLYQIHAGICRAMANPHRLALIDALRAGDRTVGDLAEAVGMSVSNTSQHLAVLKAHGLVARRREGTTCYYRVGAPSIFKAFDCMGKIVLESTEIEAAHRAYLREQIPANEQG